MASGRGASGRAGPTRDRRGALGARNPSPSPRSAEPPQRPGAAAAPGPGGGRAGKLQGHAPYGNELRPLRQWEAAPGEEPLALSLKSLVARGPASHWTWSAAAGAGRGAGRRDCSETSNFLNYFFFPNILIFSCRNLRVSAFFSCVFPLLDLFFFFFHFIFFLNLRQPAEGCAAPPLRPGTRSPSGRLSPAPPPLSLPFPFPFPPCCSPPISGRPARPSRGHQCST